MITYVDTSVVVKLLISEEGSLAAADLCGRAEQLVAVPLVAVETRAALASAARNRRLTARQHEQAKRSLAELLGGVLTVELDPTLLASAAELAESEALRGYDAVHLAGAVRAAETMASADLALCVAAARRGLAVANPLDARR